MTPTGLMTVLISAIGAFTAVCTAVFGIVWRLSSNTARSNVLVETFARALQDWKEGYARTQAEADAAAKQFHRDVQQAIAGFEVSIENLKHGFELIKMEWEAAHRAVAMIADHETRLQLLERDHERNHPAPEVSGRHLLPPDDGVPEVVECVPVRKKREGPDD